MFWLLVRIEPLEVVICIVIGTNQGEGVEFLVLMTYTNSHAILVRLEYLKGHSRHVPAISACLRWFILPFKQFEVTISTVNNAEGVRGSILGPGDGREEGGTIGG